MTSPSGERVEGERGQAGVGMRSSCMPELRRGVQCACLRDLVEVRAHRAAGGGAGLIGQATGRNGHRQTAISPFLPFTRVPFGKPARPGRARDETLPLRAARNACSVARHPPLSRCATHRTPPRRRAETAGRDGQPAGPAARWVGDLHAVLS